MAIALSILTVVGRVDTANALRQAKACARRAIELDDTLSEAHAAHAVTLMFCDFQLAEALREAQRGFELDPRSVVTRYCFGQTLAAAGRLDEAIEVLGEGCDLDPLMAPINYAYGLVLNYAHRWDEAVVQYRRTLEISPNFFLAHAMLGVALARAGRKAEAMAHVNQGKPDSVSELVKAHVAAILGDRELALSILARRDAAPPAVAAYFAAAVYGFLGDLDKGFAELERAWELRFAILASAKVNPSLDPFRDDPRWERFIKSLNLGI
jgi:tetratricopeptide (TPR) repeat protein